MAGDLSIREQVIVLGRGAQAPREQTAAAVLASGGRVLHCFGPRVLVTEVPEGVETAVRATVSQDALSPTVSEVPGRLREELDNTGLLGLKALELRQSAEFVHSKVRRPLVREAWDTALASPPDAVAADVLSPDTQALLAPGIVLAPSPTSAFLIGSVAVGLILVQGPTPNLKFSDEEQAKVVAEVQNGLSWLGTREAKAGVSWSYDIHVVKLSTPPGSANLTFSQKETLWRDPAMVKLGYGPGLDGVRAYIQDLRTRLRTRWSYCAFFTKYPLGHFAYASLGGPRLVMDYANDGWGPDNIDRVFAHETGHIFGAPDEYASSGCDCGGQWGYLKTANGNCQNCATGGGVACIMRSNDWAMCDHTLTHLGWRDRDNDGVLDPDDPIYNPKEWIYSRLCRRYPWLCRFLRAPERQEQEDLVPVALLARILSNDDLQRVEAEVRKEEEIYLSAIAAQMEQAVAEVRSSRH